MVDACVFAAAADPSEPGHASARRALDLLHEHQVNVRISAIAYAQLGRGPGGGTRKGTIGVLAFDESDGVALAKHFPSAVMKSFGTSKERARWDFDALIIASTVANSIEAIVTLDVGDFKRLLDASFGLDGRDGPRKPWVLHPDEVKPGEETDGQMSIFRGTPA